MYSFRIVVVLVFSLTCTLSSNTQAFQAEPINQSIQAEEVISPEKFRSLVPYEINSFMAKTAEGDNDAIEINISMRYFFNSSDDKKMVDTKGANLFFSYTTKSDFYWLGHDTRPSAPVISRLQNPALHFRYEFSGQQDTPIFGDEGDWLDVGVEHISNGQALDATSANAQAIINANNTNNRAYMDSISRVGMAGGLTFEGRKKIPGSLESDLTIKWYALRGEQDAVVFWGPYANQNVDFNSFQRCRIQSRTAFPVGGNKWQFNAELNVGSLGLPESSWNFLLNTPFKIASNYTIPFGFSIHRGPMNNISDYTKSQNTFAAGLTFSY